MRKFFVVFVAVALMVVLLAPPALADTIHCTLSTEPTCHENINGQGFAPDGQITASSAEQVTPGGYTLAQTQGGSFVAQSPDRENFLVGGQVIHCSEQSGCHTTPGY
jgi:hypothetical protein